MTTNLAKYINSILRGAPSLPICALVKITLKKKNKILVPWMRHKNRVHVTSRSCISWRYYCPTTKK